MGYQGNALNSVSLEIKRERFSIMNSKSFDTARIAHDFSLEAFVDFMMIQSNVNVQIENGQKTADEVRDWMFRTLAPVFDSQISRNGHSDSVRTFIFDGYYWYIRHQ